MSAVVLGTVLFAVAGAVWCAAGAALLAQALRERSHPDCVFAIGLLCGGLLLGVDMTTVAGAGPFPLAGLALTLAYLGATAFGAVDGANALLPENRPRLWLAGIATLTGLHGIHAWLGTQPAIAMGPRPFEAPVAVFLAIQSYRAFRLPKGFLVGPRRRELAWLLGTAATASVASTTGIYGADAVSAGLLCLGPLPYLFRSARSGERTVHRAGAAAAACALLFLLHTEQNALRGDIADQARLRVAAAAVQERCEELRAPLEEVVASWATEQPRRRLAKASSELAPRLQALSEAATPWPVTMAAADGAIQAVLDYQQLAAQLLGIVETEAGRWSEVDQREQAKARAVTLHRESQMALMQLHRALAAIAREEATMASSATRQLTDLQYSCLWILLAIVLLGAALVAQRDPEPVQVAVATQPVREDGGEQHLDEALAESLHLASLIDEATAEPAPEEAAAAAGSSTADQN